MMYDQYPLYKFDRADPKQVQLALVASIRDLL